MLNVVRLRVSPHFVSSLIRVPLSSVCSPLVRIILGFLSLSDLLFTHFLLSALLSQYLPIFNCLHVEPLDIFPPVVSINPTESYERFYQFVFFQVTEISGLFRFPSFGPSISRNQFHHKLQTLCCALVNLL